MADGGSPTIEDLIRDLRQIVRVGLPIRVPETPGPVLQLLGVRARAGSMAPADLASAADGQIRHIVTTFGDGPEGRAAQALFGLAPGTRGLNLTERRARAAHIVERSVDHWRKHIEPDLIGVIAQELYQREQLYRPRPAEVAPYGPIELPNVDGDTPAELSRHEATARVAAALYEYRADLLATYRLGMTRSSERACDEAQGHALFSFSRLLYFLNQYMNAFGDRILLTEQPISMSSVIQVAGWHPPFTRQERDYLMLNLVQSGLESSATFLERLSSVAAGQELRARWDEHLAVQAEGSNSA